MNSSIGPGMGNEAFMMAIRNTIMDFMYVCRNLRVKLTFTHLHSQEHFTVDGWFGIFEDHNLRKPVESVSLSPNELVWIILCLNGLSGERYPFPGPEGALDSISDWTVNWVEKERLSFGTWQIAVAVTSSSGDELYQEFEIPAR
jgi:hypothetical protein